MLSRFSRYVNPNEDDKKPFSFRWEIKRLPLRLPSVGAAIYSSAFPVIEGVSISASLSRDKVDDGEEWLSAHLELSHRSQMKKTILSDYSIVVLRAPPKQDLRIHVDAKRAIVYKSRWSFPQIFRFDELMDPAEGYLRDGHLLTVLVEGTWSSGASPLINEIYVTSIENALKAGEKYRKMLEEGVPTDFVVKAKDANGVERELKLHKANLMFFEAMFENPEWKECRDGVLEIKDFSYETMDAFFDFLIVGTFTPRKSVHGIELDLLAAADKYQIDDGLKKLLEEQVPITVENVSEIYLYAHMLNAPFLRARCADFIRFHREVAETEGWRQLKLPENEHILLQLIWDGSVIKTDKNDEDVADKLGGGSGGGGGWFSFLSGFLFPKGK